MSYFSYAEAFERLPDISLLDAKQYFPRVQFINKVMTRLSELSHAPLVEMIQQKAEQE